jgi:anthranilate synthase component 2
LVAKDILLRYFCLVLLLLDNYDSFTYNLYDYFVRCGAEVRVVRNDELDIDSIKDLYTGIIISPGPGIPANAGFTMQVIQKYHDKLPIFGVCLGMQALGEYFGAELVRASFPMHGKVSELNFQKEHPMFDSIDQPFGVCRYHSLILRNLENTPFQVVAQTGANEPMAIAHNHLPIWAVQFHPEAILTAQGITLIANWLTHFSLVDNKRISE